jgi:hypothetical protein
MMMKRLPEEIEWHFDRFVDLIQEQQDRRSDLSTLRTRYKVRTQKGRVYWKIFIDQEELALGFDIDYPTRRYASQIFGFVRRKDGAIFRAATYKAPETRTKTAIRGYIFDSNPREYFTDYGIVYAEGP